MPATSTEGRFNPTAVLREPVSWIFPVLAKSALPPSKLPVSATLNVCRFIGTVAITVKSVTDTTAVILGANVVPVGTKTLSAAPGTPAGFQFAPSCQSSLTAETHVLLVPTGIANDPKLAGVATPDTAAFTVFGPTTPPSVHPTRPRPLASAIVDGALTLPPPTGAVQLIVAPATGLPDWSTTRATTGTPRLAAGLPVCRLPESATSAAGAPARSAIVPDVTLRVPSLNWSVKLPTRPLRRSVEKAATPLPIVAVLVTSEPPLPLAIVAVIVPLAPVTVLPPTSTTRTTGCVARLTPFVAVAGGGVCSTTAAGAPALSVIVPDVMVRVPSPNCNVKFPIGPFSWSAANVATPALIVAVLLTSEPPTPEAIVAVIVPLAPGTVLPPTSTTFTTGCVLRLTPLLATAAGGVWKTTAFAAPTPRVIVPDVTVRVPSLNCSVNAPIVPLRRSVENVAMPAVIGAVAVIREPPAPDAIVAVIVPLAPVTVLPPASTTFTTGCVARSTPLVAVAGGATCSTTCAAAPTVTVTAELIAPVSPDDAAASV